MSDDELEENGKNVTDSIYWQSRLWHNLRSDEKNLFIAGIVVGIMFGIVLHQFWLVVREVLPL